MLVWRLTMAGGKRHERPSDRFLADQFQSALYFRITTSVVRYSEAAPALFRSLRHAQRFGVVHRHRLFAQNVFPDFPDHLVCLSAFAGVLCGQSARQVPGPLNYQAVLSFLPNETVERRLGRTQFPNGKATSATRVYRAFLPESQRKERWKVYDS